MIFLTEQALLVRDTLLLQGLETPFLVQSGLKNRLNDQVREARIAENMLAILHLLNIDSQHDSIIDTPKRIARMYLKDFFYGLNYANFPKITMFKNTMNMDEVITVRNINVISMCEHHFIIFSGIATVAYIPNKHIIGLSKINRLVDFFSRRPQVQERLTKQIFLALQVLLDTKNVAISIDAVHFCVKARGVGDNSSTITFASGGILKKTGNNIY
ncbi:GTP cyclohydrolase I FolE [Blochmannia endosymbiont of Polyrhachis (Hedomyrma) turneri]|uniref:GTP cyclohydrolase I FolE n=1 Tax=Blochmannia endosymbiont of Polyrhachis (Hedomyrma) turneri TaxID=1505596 RepID=UPI00061A6CA0|nr:GTP cyclohydrolase I FolE [Blochmannia endosymbiont of Polyrhachis (Hedomyrma) turneri]AKC60034.1 GTP cyclohydrolase 1 [Blochmannia endosymbiont of Polyrhachis (Hedomyrma) turneri]